MTADLTGVVLNPGEYVSLRWFDADGQANDDGLAVDNLSVSFTPVPEPGVVVALAASGLGLAGLVRRLRGLFGPRIHATLAGTLRERDRSRATAGALP
jgi:hypothetical protein